MVDEPTQPAADEASEGEQKYKGKSSKAYLAWIAAEKKCAQPWHDRCDNIAKWYAEGNRLASLGTDRQFQMFWANMEVLRPSIYSRPPVPVIVPRFKDRKPIPREASKVLERCSITNFEQEDIDTTMRLVRDDLLWFAQGVCRVWYEAGGNGAQYARIQHVDRKDFLRNTSARYWHEVEMVAFASWLTKAKAKKRFEKVSGKAYTSAKYAKQKMANGETEYETTACFWEIWDKAENRIVWVSEGVEVILDTAKPEEMTELDGFFPCPRPAFGTLEPSTLKPVPDFLQYKDQLEEINELTARISALAEALKVRGFYPGGAEDIADAVEAALKDVSNTRVLIPVANWAAIGQTNGNIANMIAYLPLEMVANTIAQLLEQRRALFDDVYQLTGMSDIMRGSTDPNETLGAQQLKSQYGSIRVKEKQSELVRVARDITRLQGEVMAENFEPQTLMDMSQVELPTVAQVQEQIDGLHQQKLQLEAQAKQLAMDPQVQAMAQQQPEQAQQAAQALQQQVGQLDAQMQELTQTVTIDAVVALLRDQRLRPFILDIETDSTIQPDEDAAKQRMTEFVTAVGGFVGQAFPMVQQEQRLAPFVGEMLKQASSVFRAGREMEGIIDELVDQMKQMAGAPQPDPEAEARQAEQALQQQEADQKAAERQQDQEFRREEHEWKREEHSWDMECKKADSERATVEFDQKQQSEKTKSDEALKKQMVDKGLPPDMTVEKVEEMNAQQMEALAAMMEQQRAAQEAQTNIIVQAMQAMVSAITAPKQIIRDQNGRPVGVETMMVN